MRRQEERPPPARPAVHPAVRPAAVHPAAVRSPASALPEVEALQRRAGNAAVARALQKHGSAPGLLQRMWDGETGDTQAGPSNESASNKRKRTDSNESPAAAVPGPGSGAPAVLTPDLLDWMSRPDDFREWNSDPQAVREIGKRDVELVCWKWAAAAFSETSGPDQGDFWNALLDGNVSDKPWYSALAEPVRQQLDRIVVALARGNWKERTAAANSNRQGLAPDEQGAAEQQLRDGVRAFATVHGLRVVDEVTGTFFVCQYKPREGMAVPEHWWLELEHRGRPIVIQTVAGKPLETGGDNLRWHSATSHPGRSSDKNAYRMIRLPIAHLKPEHIAVLNSGMADEPDQLLRKVRARVSEWFDELRRPTVAQRKAAQGWAVTANWPDSARAVPALDWARTVLSRSADRRPENVKEFVHDNAEVKGWHQEFKDRF